MIVQHTVPDRSMDALSTEELDWDALYADLAPRVFNYFHYRLGRYRLGRESDVEDLTSRTFEKAWRSRARYRRDLAGFSTWLFKIAQNVAADHFSSRRQHLPLEVAYEIPAEDSPAWHAELHSDLARLAALTANLPARDQELIALKYGASLNNRLIAGLTGLTESNVGTILHRLVQTLRSQWHDQKERSR